MQVMRSVESGWTRAQQPKVHPTWLVDPLNETDWPRNNRHSMPSAVLILGRKDGSVPGVCLRWPRSAFNSFAPSSQTCRPFVCEKLAGSRERLESIGRDESGSDTTSA